MDCVGFTTRLVIAQMVQLFTQLVPGAVDVRLYGSKRQVEGGGDLLVRSPLDVPQHNAGSVLGPEARDGPLDGAAKLLGLHLVEGRFLVADDVERRRLDRVLGRARAASRRC